MKKTIVLCLMLGCMTAVFAGCDSAKEKETTATEAVTEEGDGEKNRKTEEEETSDVPVLGGEDVEGYEGFSYLYEELLMTETRENEETGKKERKKLTVYIPDSEYAAANGNSAHSSSMGVDFYVELDPYMGYNAKDYLLEENLDKYVGNKYDPFYIADYKDVVISEAKASGNGVVSTVEYCAFNEFDEVYYSVFCTYYLTEFEDGKTVLVSTEIKNTEVTGKTEKLLDELEQFYQFDIDWDEERAVKKIADCEVNTTENNYSTGNLLFELPEGWEEAKDASLKGANIYAPGGTVKSTGCMVTIFEDDFKYDDESIDPLVLVMSGGDAMIKEMLGDAVTDYASELCETGLGEAVKITCTVSDGEEKVSIVMYIVIEDSKMFRFMSLETEGATDSSHMVLDGIMQSGQIRK